MVVWCINVYVNANFTQWEFKHLNSLKAFPNMKMERAFAKINVFVCMYVASNTNILLFPSQDPALTWLLFRWDTFLLSSPFQR